jgi:hypothetical protein
MTHPKIEAVWTRVDSEVLSCNRLEKPTFMLEFERLQEEVGSPDLELQSQTTGLRKQWFRVTLVWVIQIYDEYRRNFKLHLLYEERSFDFMVKSAFRRCFSVVQANLSSLIFFDSD